MSGKIHILIFSVMLLSFGMLIPDNLFSQSKGIWVECEGDNATLSSTRKILEMLDTVRDCGFDTVFVQIYRHDRAWFDTKNSDDQPFKEFKEREKTDLFTFIINEAHKRNIKVHAWMNMFRVGKDRNAKIIKTLGPDVVTMDNKGRSMLDYPDLQLPGEENRYYEADRTGFWLEPGDKKVQDYLLKVIRDVVKKYPDIDGVHLDFVRYPYTVPFSPGSRFPKGITYGYGKGSAERFKKIYGMDPLNPSMVTDTMQKWDDWRRDQITDFVKSVKKLLGRSHKNIKLSAAVVCWADRAYLTAFQDWRRWLEEGIVDFVCLMNYSIDERFFRYISFAGNAFKSKGKVCIGIGAYILGNRPDIFAMQIEDCLKIGVDGIAFFSYDSMVKKREFFEKAKEKLRGP